MNFTFLRCFAALYICFLGFNAKASDPGEPEAAVKVLRQPLPEEIDLPAELWMNIVHEHADFESMLALRATNYFFSQIVIEDSRFEDALSHMLQNAAYLDRQKNSVYDCTPAEWKKDDSGKSLDDSRPCKYFELFKHWMDHPHLHPESVHDCTEPIKISWNLRYCTGVDRDSIIAVAKRYNVPLNNNLLDQLLSLRVAYQMIPYSYRAAFATAESMVVGGSSMIITLMVAYNGVLIPLNCQTVYYLGLQPSLNPMELFFPDVQQALLSTSIYIFVKERLLLYLPLVYIVVNMYDHLRAFDTGRIFKRFLPWTTYWYGEEDTDLYSVHDAYNELKRKRTWYGSPLFKFTGAFGTMVMSCVGCIFYQVYNLHLTGYKAEPALSLNLWENRSHIPLNACCRFISVSQPYFFNCRNLDVSDVSSLQMAFQEYVSTGLGTIIPLMLPSMIMLLRLLMILFLGV